MLWVSGLNHHCLISLSQISFIKFPALNGSKKSKLFNSKLLIIGKIFSLIGVFLSITKIEDSEWNEKVSETKELIKTYLNKKLNDFRNQLIEFSSNNKNKKIKSTDITSKKIIQILDEYVKPAVASDGGNILFDSYNKKNKVVNVILQGACSGCPSSTITLKNGIENILKEMLPGVVKNVIAINE